jgi:hypothetical protein
VDRWTAMENLHGLVMDLIRRQIRLRAHEIYEERGRAEGFALEDWLTAESEVLKTSILAPFYQHSRNRGAATPTFDSDRGTPRALVH